MSQEAYHEGGSITSDFMHRNARKRSQILEFFLESRLAWGEFRMRKPRKNLLTTGTWLSMVFLSFCLFLSFSEASAQQVSAGAQLQCDKVFPCPEELVSRVQFWVRVFAEFGDRRVLFHNRDRGFRSSRAPWIGLCDNNIDIRCADWLRSGSCSEELWERICRSWSYCTAMSFRSLWRETYIT